MNKSLLHEQILLVLDAIHRRALAAAAEAHNTATHEENVAENKYDTLGLEAAYLAHGQSERVAECEADLVVFKNLMPTQFSDQTPVSLGALVSLINTDGLSQLIFIGPVGGGERIHCCDSEILIVTPAAPLGQALLEQFVGDEVTLTIDGKKQVYDIDAVF